jgi:hypothetical protein
MRCRICDQELREPSPDQHCAEKAPMYGDICLGCWTASVELELFLVRARPDRCVMGAWAEGVLREVLADPRKFLRD